MCTLNDIILQLEGNDMPRYVGPVPFDTLVEWMSRLSYKPDYDMTLIPADPNLPASTAFVEFSCMVPNSRAQTKDPWGDVEVIRIAMQRAIWPYAITTFAEFRDLVFDGWETFEKHEMREWFRVDGQLFRDPHL